MILLRNFDFATRYFDFESKLQMVDEKSPEICGWYTSAYELISALMVVDNKLYFVYGGEEFLLTDHHKVLLKQISKVEIEYNLMHDNDIIVSFRYLLSDSNLNVSPFEYIDDDFIWGQFIGKIINDPERQMNFVNAMGAK